MYILNPLFFTRRQNHTFTLRQHIYKCYTLSRLPLKAAIFLKHQVLAIKPFLRIQQVGVLELTHEHFLFPRFFIFKAEFLGAVNS